MRLRVAAALTAVLLAGSTPPAAATGIASSHNDIAPEGPSAVSRVNTGLGEHAMVVTANPQATATALNVLRNGGNAVDAAVAAQMVLGLVEPQSSGLGGGAFLLYWDAKTRTLTYYDGRETAPAGVDTRLFLTDHGKPMQFLDAVIGGRSVGVPGVLRMLERLHNDHGKRPWGGLFRPAIQLSERGFRVSPRLHALLADTPRLAVRQPLKDYFFPTGKPLATGTVRRNPAYAKTLTSIATGGADAFYRGPLAGRIATAVQHDPINPGYLTTADLAGYKAKKRQPVCGPFRNFRVCSTAPPSSGGVTVLMILGLLERTLPPDWQAHTPQFAHLFAAASRLAFADRDTWLADSDFVRVPVAGLLAPGYLDRRARLIDRHHMLPVVRPGQPPTGDQALKRHRALSPELPGTSHLSIIDSDGNALVMTTTIETAFGSRLMVDGFLLNNQLTDFSFVPRDSDGRLVANRVQPGKRPRSSMAPTIAFDADGNPVFLIGSPGGSHIIDYVAQSLALVLGQRLSLPQALAAGHIVDTNQALILERGRFDDRFIAALTAIGHHVITRPETSGLGGIVRTPQGWLGGADPRREGVATGF